MKTKQVQSRGSRNPDIIDKHCYRCGHDYFLRRLSGDKCSKCKSAPTKLETYKNKHGKERTRVVLE